MRGRTHNEPRPLVLPEPEEIRHGLLRIVEKSSNVVKHDSLLRTLLDRSWELVLGGFGKKKQREILSAAGCGQETISSI